MMLAAALAGGTVVTVPVKGSRSRHLSTNEQLVTLCGYAVTQSVGLWRDRKICLRCRDRFNRLQKLADAVRKEA